MSPCMCGATDCVSCGPAQGYEVVKVWNRRLKSWQWVNPEMEESDEDYILEDDVSFDPDEDYRRDK